MSYLVLARKYRPQTFAEMVGQDHVTRTLVNAIVSDRVAHAILFAGPRGTGKTTVARILAKAMNCAQGPAVEPCNQCRSCREITSGSAVDVFEIDGASNNGVDHVRDLRENAKYKPAHCRLKIYIIDEVHMLSTPAFNALLKTLEEPPAHVMFLFATTEPHKIPITILSRCQRHDFRRISLADIAGRMRELCRREEVTMDEEGLALIAREAGGSMRDALSLLDQVIACAGREVTARRVQEILGSVDSSIVFAVSEQVIRGDLAALLDIVGDVHDHGYPIREFYSVLLDHFRNLLIVKMGQRVDKLVDLPAHDIARMGEQVAPVSVAFLSSAFELLFKAEAAVKLSEQPRLALELALMRILSVKPALPIEVLIGKLDELRQSIAREPAGRGEGQGPARPTGRREEASAPSGPGGAEPAPEEGERFQAGDPPEVVWRKLVDAVARKHPSLGPHLQVCSLAAIGPAGLDIAVNGSSFNGSTLRKKKALDNLRQVAAEFFGRPMDLRIRDEGRPGVSLQSRVEQENEVRQAAWNNPLVQDAIEIFKAEVRQVKVLQPGPGDSDDAGPVPGKEEDPKGEGVVIPFRR